MSWSIGVDVGGTFTDFFASHEHSGEVHVAKVPSTPANPADAVIAGLRDLLARHGIDRAAVHRLSHGTTVGTNALIQRRGGKVAMITTRGFRDLLEIGRQTRPHMYDLYADHPPPLVPREHRIELRERIGADGEVLLAPDAADIDAAVERVLAAGAEACAVCFLFAYRNAEHEQAVAEVLSQRGDGLSVSLSCEVQPEFREYERFSTTVLNAYLQPVIAAYVTALEEGVRAAVPAAEIGINQSSGGLMSPARTRGLPVRTALSGPAAGAVGAIHVARLAARPNVITLDMGGTSADVALIRDYRAEITFDRSVAGFPVRLPSVDIETVGAGGGSVAWFDRDGLLKVGPGSAGADPGPACYARGGEQPTVTDANLLLGRLSTRGLLDGAMALDSQRAAHAFAPLAERLGFSLQRTAHGVLGIVVANMVRALRTVSVERGYDPRQCTLMPFGGAGPLHARDVALELGISEILVPAAPGIVCAQGLIVSDLKEDFVHGERMTVRRGQPVDLETSVSTLLARAQTWLEAEGVPREKRRYELSVDARYVGQNFELAVPLADGPSLDARALPDADGLYEKFFAVHETAYGFHNPHDAIEIINFRLTARGRLYATSPSPAPQQAPPPLASSQTRDIWFSYEAPHASPVYARESLRAGHLIDGPAVIEQLDATTLVYPGDRAWVDAEANIIITINPSAEEST